MPGYHRQGLQVLNGDVDRSSADVAGPIVGEYRQRVRSVGGLRGVESPLIRPDRFGLRKRIVHVELDLGNADVVIGLGLELNAARQSSAGSWPGHVYRWRLGVVKSGYRAEVVKSQSPGDSRSSRQADFSNTRNRCIGPSDCPSRSGLPLAVGAQVLSLVQPVNQCVQTGAA